MPDEPQQVTVSLSLQEIHDALCEPCRDAVIDLLARKASTAQIRDSLRSQLVPPKPAANEHRPGRSRRR